MFLAHNGKCHLKKLTTEVYTRKCTVLCFLYQLRETETGLLILLPVFRTSHCERPDEQLQLNYHYLHQNLTMTLLFLPYIKMYIIATR